MSRGAASSACPSTFSIVAADPGQGEVGVAVQSKFLAVGAVVPWARGGVGAVATQAAVDVRMGPGCLDLLERGRSSEEALDLLLASDRVRSSRQLGVVDASGSAASFTGEDCFAHAASLVGVGYACQGNILASHEVVPAMASAFESADGRLAERMVEALRAGQRAGGDRRGQESASLLVAKLGQGYGGGNDRYVDLRVDHHVEPIEELGRLLGLHRFYFQRPDAATVLEVDAELESELRALLRGLGRLDPPDDTWRALEDFMGWENLEERWVGAGSIDPMVLDHLRRLHHERVRHPAASAIGLADCRFPSGVDLAEERR